MKFIVNNLRRFEFAMFTVIQRGERGVETLPLLLLLLLLIDYINYKAALVLIRLLCVCPAGWKRIHRQSMRVFCVYCLRSCVTARGALVL